jgi:hypothetical protein
MYQPTERDKKFAREMVRVMKDGGIMMVPSYPVPYRFNHQRKELVCARPELLGACVSAVMHGRHKAVFATVGWKVLP